MLTCVNLKSRVKDDVDLAQNAPNAGRYDYSDEGQVAQMYEMMLERKWGRWQWRVCDSAGKAIVVGREKSREAARYKAARALFELLLSSRLCDLHEPRRNERR